MNTRLLTLIPLAALLSIAIPSPAHAEDTSLSAVFHQAYRMGHRLEVRAMNAINATPQQRRAVERAGAQLAQDLRPLARECEDLVVGMVEVWVAPTIEAQSVEALRQDTLSLLDAASVPVGTFVVEAGNTLTSSQRQDLLDAAVDTIRDLAQ